MGAYAPESYEFFHYLAMLGAYAPEKWAQSLLFPLFCSLIFTIYKLFSWIYDKMVDFRRICYLLKSPDFDRKVGGHAPDYPYAKDLTINESTDWLVIVSYQNLQHDVAAKGWFLDKSTKTYQLVFHFRENSIFSCICSPLTYFPCKSEIIIVLVPFCFEIGEQKIEIF